MPKLDLDAAKKRCEELERVGLPYDCDIHARFTKQLVGRDLPAALRECAWSREMLERAEVHITYLEQLTRMPRIKATSCDFLRDLEKGPPDELA